MTNAREFFYGEYFSPILYSHLGLVFVPKSPVSTFESEQENFSGLRAPLLPSSLINNVHRTEATRLQIELLLDFESTTVGGHLPVSPLFSGRIGSTEPLLSP